MGTARALVAGSGDWPDELALATYLKLDLKVPTCVQLQRLKVLGKFLRHVDDAADCRGILVSSSSRGGV
jgi:hypothetical protein